jgi:hypothetical protein
MPSPFPTVFARVVAVISVTAVSGKRPAASAAAAYSAREARAAPAHRTEKTNRRRGAGVAVHRRAQVVRQGSPLELWEVEVGVSGDSPVYTVFRARKGTTLSFTLSSAATVVGKLAREVPGRRAGGKCDPKRKRGKRCTALVGARTLRFAGKTGETRVYFGKGFTRVASTG